jgi:tetratricopeptide (TPR) repeat protein
MAVEEGVKVIRSGEVEIYDVLADPRESENLAGRLEVDASLREALARYAEEALRESEAVAANLDPEVSEKLASLGYFGSSGRPVLREDAPNPREMTHLFHGLDLGASRFVAREYESAILVYSRVLEADPENFAVVLGLAVAHSLLGEESEALGYFDRAREIDAFSIDLRHYQAMHHLRNREWDLARPLFESVLVEMPERLPALEGLAQIYTRQGQLEDAVSLLEKITTIKDSPGLELARLGELRMAKGETAAAIRAFESSRDLLGRDFAFHLELGVLYLADSRLVQAAASLDRVSASHPGFSMALFKRAQVSVLLSEPDRVERVRRAWAEADEATRPLIENEQLFAGISLTE